MYRCTECNTEYENKPDYCECGNDIFVETEQEEEQVSVKPNTSVKKKADRKLSAEEIAELAEEELDKKKALITIGISLLICVIILFLPPHRAKKLQKNISSVENPASMKIIDVNSYWDSTLPSASRKKDPYANLPILNSNFGSITNDLKQYLQNIGAEYSRLWDRSGIRETGECRVVFTINKEGVLELNKMLTASNKRTLDDSVLLLISKVKSFDVPPDDYKGQKIIIAFTVNPDGSSKVYYPSR